ncbi:ribonuclease domain-containing protein [Pantoea sp. A4]|uniref:ribonuclease domain-containing protein n=1 Tax=Pantoea sp. A4 TaxID=1225184 RepID=UPI000362E116|nr:ribonuclease domain-containing protein [Pantoea sp. A4]
MKNIRWIGLIALLAVCWYGLKPHFSPNTPASVSTSQNITAMTDAQQVARWVHQHHQLPDFYLTKREARQRGWDPARGNLCEALPGHAIGGDRFSNREGRLPEQQGRRWFEADVNYRCGHREADRLLFSSDGLVFLTRDHYRTFTALP